MSNPHDASAHAAMRAMMSPDPDLNQTDRTVYAYLVYRANGGRECWQTVGEIMADLGISTRSVACAATRKLREKGLIEVRHRRRDSNRYRILDPGGRLYTGSGGNGATEWQRPPTQDVRKTELLEPQDVRKTELLNGHQDVRKTELLEPQDVRNPARLQIVDVRIPIHESLNKGRKKTKGGSVEARVPRAGRRAASPRTTVPPDFCPDAKGEQYAVDHGVPLTQVAAFINHHTAEANLKANWQAAWRTWVDRYPQFARRDSRRNGWAELIEIEGMDCLQDRRGQDGESDEAFMERIVGHA